MYAFNTGMWQDEDRTYLPSERVIDGISLPFDSLLY